MDVEAALAALHGEILEEVSDITFNRSEISPLEKNDLFVQSSMTQPTTIGITSNELSSSKTEDSIMSAELSKEV